MAFILFLLKCVRAGSNQQKNSSPPPVPPGTRALPDCPQPETTAFGLRTAEPPRGRKRPSRALCTATPCGVRQRTLRRVLEYFAASTIPHSARHAFIRPKKKEGRTRDIPRIRPPFLRQCSLYSALLCSSAAAAERRRRFGFSSTTLASVFTPASSGSIMMRPQYSHTIIFLRMRMSS